MGREHGLSLPRPNVRLARAPARSRPEPPKQPGLIDPINRQTKGLTQGEDRPVVQTHDQIQQNRSHNFLQFRNFQRRDAYTVWKFFPVFC